MNALQIVAQISKEDSGLPDVTANGDAIQKALAIVFGVFAAIAVLVIVLAAIDFASSSGNPEKISKAKNSIIYALIGLVISLSAEVIVYTVLQKV